MHLVIHHPILARLWCNVCTRWTQNNQVKFNTPRTLQTLHNDSLTTVNLIRYNDDKGVEMCSTGC